ncbi:MAG TPA: hypothetical protein VF292_03010 [Rhodanobacteraceae bacterium]
MNTSRATQPTSKAWALTDHVCRHCGGRVLQGTTGFGPTPGGNPAFQCADCGARASGTGPDVLCWCGFAHRQQNAGAYRCLPFSVLTAHPELEPAFRACGCDPQRGQIGIVTVADLQRLIRK